MKKLLRILCFWSLILLCFDAAAQNLLVKVQETNSGQPVAVAYVNVYAKDSRSAQQTVLTDDKGEAEIMLTGFPCRIEVLAIGYENYVQPFDAYPAHKDFTVLLSKKPSSSLNEVVVTGLTHPTAMQNALSQYRTISGAAIQAQGSVTLADALTTQLNMNVSNDAVLGSSISMQGLSGDKVKILIDGMPVNGRENGNVDLGQISLNNIDHIEIVQGPMSVVYGSDALGGVINLITKKYTRPLMIQAGINYESVGKYNADVLTSFKLKKRSQLTIGAGRNYFEGWKHNDTLLVDPSSKETFPNHRSYLFKPKEQYVANVDYTYRAPSGFRMELASDFLHEKVTDESAPTIFNSFGCFAYDSYYKTTRSQTRFFMDGPLGKTGHWQSLNSYAYYNRIRNSYITDLATLNQTLDESAIGGQDTSTFNDINSRGTYSNKWKKLDYTVGYDVLLEFAKSDKIKNGVNNIQDYAAYSTLSMPLFTEKLVGQVGLRASYNTQYAAPLTPAVNLLYKMSDQIQFRASYCKGFRAPTLKELYLEFIDLNHHIIGNANLKAETSDNFQVSGSYQFYKLGANYAQLIVTGYYNDIDNEITLVNNQPNNANSIDYTYGNIAHMRNAIANVQAETQWQNLHLQLGYAYTYTFSEAGSYSEFGASEIAANAQYAWPAARLRFNVFYKYTGVQPALQQNIDGSASFNGKMPAYNTMDASVERKFFNKKLSVVAGVKNIFNVQELKSTDGTVAILNNPHGGNGTMNFLPRRFFTTIRLTLY